MKHEQWLQIWASNGTACARIVERVDGKEEVVTSASTYFIQPGWHTVLGNAEERTSL